MYYVEINLRSTRRWPWTRTSQVIKYSWFVIFFFFFSWRCEPVEKQVRQSGNWPNRSVLTAKAETAVLLRLHMNACYAVVHSSHGKSSSGFLFMSTNPLIHGCRENDEMGGGGRQSKRQMTCGLPMSCHCPPSSFSLLFLHFCPISLSLRAWDASRFPFSLITALVNCVSEPK